ncbi:50S ribosomal protein L25 [Clostridium hydrogeniformans]|uniref:50S ribosomal protein L25 n=1 Tax=Clostridium hydrogeniformans TaxID=349933 RepID=UPI000481DEA1|nr:50S ribosomal protein L25 [Clostridium hydrogeniformans]
MSQLAVKINEREINENSKSIRRNGETPGIIYGEFLDKSIPIKVNNSVLNKLLRYNSKGSILKLDLNDAHKYCVVKEVQKDIITGKVIHVDFQYVKENEVIKMKIPVNFIGLENLELKRLVLESFLNEIEMQGQVEKIPEYIEIDVSKNNYDDKIFVKDIKLPEGVRLLTEGETLLAVVNG